MKPALTLEKGEYGLAEKMVIHRGVKGFGLNSARRDRLGIPGPSKNFKLEGELREFVEEKRS